MKTYRRKCKNGYHHYWVRLNGEVTECGTTVAGTMDNKRKISWDREILLECARCEVRVYIDSVIRSYPFPWVFALDPFDNFLDPTEYLEGT